jgi:hypothetical protein
MLAERSGSILIVLLNPPCFGILHEERRVRSHTHQVQGGARFGGRSYLCCVWLVRTMKI